MGSAHAMRGDFWKVRGSDQNGLYIHWGKSCNLGTLGGVFLVHNVESDSDRLGQDGQKLKKQAARPNS